MTNKQTTQRKHTNPIKKEMAKLDKKLEGTVGKSKKMSKSKLMIIIGSCIVLIPLLIFAIILISAQLSTGSPIIGNRFKGDLDPEITSSMRKDLQESIKTISGVEDCEIVLETAQFRVNVKTSATATDESAKALATTVYQKVNEKLPISTYFTSTAEKKMYDLSISVYNQLNNDDGKQIYYLLTKNSKMSEPSIQLVSKPLDENLAKELRGEIVDDSVPTEPVTEGQEEDTEQQETE